jgi:hypothetical protein
MEVQMGDNGKPGAALKGETQNGRGNGKPLRTPQDIERSYGKDAYHNIEILPDGTLRETIGHGDPRDEQVTRTLKTQRTWY